MNVIGISPLVDSCTRLVHQKARYTYQRISQENHRWLDIEDLVQDGLLEAWQAEQRYDVNKGSKYSSYLFSGLDYLFSSRYTTPLTQLKRKASLLELDAPLDSESGLMRELEVPVPSPEDVCQAVSGVVHLCLVVPPVALTFLLGVIVSGTGRIKPSTADDIAQIQVFCKRLKVRREDVLLLMSDNHAKAQFLEALLRSGTIAEDKAKVLECIECSSKFSLSDARTGLYSATSLTCKGCLENLFASGPDKTCFGREKVVDNNRTATEGYSEADEECRLHCRDRVACVRFIEERKSMAQDVGNIEIDTELDDVNLDGIDEDEDADADLTSADDDEDEGEAPVKSTKTSKTIKAAKATKTAAKSAAKKTVKPEAAKSTKKAEPAKADNKAAKKEEAAPAKTSKPAKSAAKKAAKPVSDKPKGGRTAKSTEKVDPKVALKQGLIKLDEQGRDLPFKAGSMMRWLIEQCLEPGGAAEKDLEKEVIKLGYDYKFQRAVLVSGKSGDSSLRPYPSTHTWKVEIVKDKIRLFDVKRIAFYHKMARIDGVGKKK